MDGTQVGSIYYDLDLDDKKFKGKVSDASKDLNGLAGRFKAAEGASKAFAAGLGLVGLAILGAMGKAVKAYADAEASQARFVQAMKQISKASDEQVAALVKQQKALQQITRYDDDAIASAQGFLATFQLSTDQIKFMTPRLLDMAEGLRKTTGGTVDLEQASNMLGKAIQLGTVGMLAKAGVTIPGTTKAMQDLWKAQFEVASIQERVRMTGELVDGNFKGQAESAGKTLWGAIDRLKNNFGDFMELVGEGLSKHLGPLVSKLADWFAGMTNVKNAGDLLNPVLKTLTGNLGGIGGVIVGGLIPAIRALWVALIQSPLAPFILAGLAIGIIVDQIAKAMGGWGEVMKQVSPILTDLWNWLNKTYAAMVEVWSQIATALTPVFQTLWAIMQATIIPAFRFLWDIIENQVIPVFKKIWQDNAPQTILVLKALAYILGGLLLSAFTVIMVAIAEVAYILAGLGYVIAKVQGWFGDLKKAIENALDWDKVINAAVNFFKTKFNELLDWLKKWAEKAKNLLDKLNPFNRASPSLIDNITKGVDVIKARFSLLDNMNIPSVAKMGVQDNSRTITNAPTISFYGDINNTDDKSLDDIGGRIARQLELSSQGVF